MWRERFGSDSQVIGRPLRVSREDAQPETLRIVGVLPPGFWFGRDSSDTVDVMTPLRTRMRTYMVRLREGVPVSFAEKRITDAATTVGSDFRPDWTGVHLQSAHDRYVESIRPVLIGITIAVAVRARAGLCECCRPDAVAGHATTEGSGGAPRWGEARHPAHAGAEAV
jgi:hypothetical protein